uniref:Uncharacterized protein n=1 Tax=Ciona intestinalis TaxID=7719 RepID=H2XX50_CIOIN
MKFYNMLQTANYWLHKTSSCSLGWNFYVGKLL